MKSLDLLMMFHSATEALVTFLKSAIHLKKLSVILDRMEEYERAMLINGLRENGSLVKVGRGLPRLYCRRNKQLRLLLGERPLPSAKLSLVPSLLHAAKAAKKMAPNTIFMGLLGCDRLSGGTEP
jgi:hypothetical protein